MFSGLERRGLLCALVGAAVALMAWPGVCSAFEPTESAELSVTVTDDQGKPIEGAAVEFALGHASEQAKSFSATVTDSKGVAKLQMKCPEGAQASLVWLVRASCRKEGLWDQDATATLFPGARAALAITMRHTVVTVIRVLGPDGQPVVGAPISASYSPGPGEYFTTEWPGPCPVTDPKGQYVWKHPRLGEEGTLEIADDAFPLGNDAEITVRLAELQMMQLPHRQRLDGRVLNDDGTAAIGAVVAKARATGGFGSGSYYATAYTATDAIEVDKEGRFAIDVEPGSILAIYTPLGVPLQRDLNPACWAKDKHVTLRLPPVRKMRKGQLVWADGKPAAGVAIIPRLGGDSLHLSPSEKVIPRSIITDKDGRYELPIYFGLTTWFEPKDAATVDQRPLTKDKVAIQPIPQASPEANYWLQSWKPQRRFHVRVKDAAGKVIENAELALGHDQFASFLRRMPPFTGRALMIPSTDGMALLTDDAIETAPVSVWAEGYEPMNQDLDLSVAEEHVFDLVLPDANRLRLLKGVVLDADGKPAKAVDVTWYMGATPTSLPSGADAERTYGGSVTTGRDGAFQLYASGAGELEAYTRGGVPSLGWVEPVRFDAASRDVTVRFQRGGSVKVVIPQSQRALPGHLQYMDAQSTWQMPESRRISRDTFIFPHVRPGKWELVMPEPSSWRSSVFAGGNPDNTVLAKLQVQDGKETVIDLRDKAVAALLPDMFTVKVTADGKPLSGAIINVYSTLARKDEKLAASIKALADNDWRVRDQADKTLRQAERSGIATILASKLDDLEARARAQNILDDDTKSIFAPSCVPRLAAADLSDDDGAAQFSLQPGRRYIVVARVPGKLVGLTSFYAGDDKQKTIEIAVARARTFELPRPDSSELYIHADFLKPDEAMALMDTLGAHIAPSLSPRAQVLEDLPAGQTYGLSWGSETTTASKTVVLPAKGEPIEPLQDEHPLKPEPTPEPATGEFPAAD